MTSRLTFFSVAVLVLFAQPLAAVQILSPSVVDPAKQAPGRQDANTGNQPGANDLSRQLLGSVQSMVPFPIEGSGIEEPLQGAIRKLITGQPAEAIAEMNQLREARADLPPGSLLIAGMLFTTGDTTQGRVWIERTAAESPEYPTVWTGLARLAINELRVADSIALLEKGRRTIDDGTWTDEQKKLFEVDYLDGLVDVSIARQELAEARTHLLKLREMLPDDSRVPLRLAQVEFDLNNVDASFQYLEESRKAAPQLRPAEVIIAEWYLQKQDTKASEEWIVRAAEKYPDNAAVLLDQARWLLQADKLPEAAAALEKAGSSGGDPWVIQFLKGQVAFARRAYDVAEGHFETIIRERPGDADATNMLALCLAESADRTRQERALELAMLNQRQYPRSATAAATLGWAYFRLGRMDEAQNVFQQIAATRQLEPASAYYMARFLQSRNDVASAAALLEQAVNSSGYFMFRAAANELLAELRSRLESATPTPADTPPDDAASGKDSGKDDQDNRP